MGRTHQGAKPLVFDRVSCFFICIYIYIDHSAATDIVLHVYMLGRKTDLAFQLAQLKELMQRRLDRELLVYILALGYMEYVTSTWVWANLYHL